MILLQARDMSPTDPLPSIVPSVTASSVTAVVVAHPDDECLWLSSVLATASRVILAFGDPFERPRMAVARRAAVQDLPLPGLIDLALPESGAGFSIDWSWPRLTATGIAIEDPAARSRYDANFNCLLNRLRASLEGCTDVYTHNPWGEYGHAEHIQVHRAVMTLQAELGFTVWFSNYVGARSWNLARQWAHIPYRTTRQECPTNRVLARQLMQIYRKHRAWTWTRWHHWPRTEILYARPAMKQATNLLTLAGESLLDIDVLRRWPPVWRSLHRKLR